MVESTTKWVGGHSDVLAGAVAGHAELMSQVRETEIETGGMIAPFAAFLVLRGMETLHVRMDRHAASALVLANALEARPEVRSVIYPGLDSHPQAAVARRELRNGGGLMAIDLGERADRVRVHRCAHHPAPHRVAGEHPDARRASAVEHPSPAG